jgi:hypothetical protein
LVDVPEPLPSWVTEPVPGMVPEPLWVLVVVGVVVVGEEVVVGVVDDVELVVVDVDGEVVVLVVVVVPLHSLSASVRSVVDPCVRFETSCRLVLDGRSESVASSIDRALFAFAQEPLLTASLTALRSLTIVRLAFCDRAPVIGDCVPQPTTKAAADASPPAVSARERSPMCRVTLEAPGVGFMCV